MNLLSLGNLLILVTPVNLVILILNLPILVNLVILVPCDFDDFGVILFIFDTHNFFCFKVEIQMLFENDKCDLLSSLKVIIHAVAYIGYSK